MLINQFVYFESPGEPSLYARVTEIRAKTAVLKTLKDYGHLKNSIWGVTTRNREQNFAMNLLMDPEVDFVSLTGTAGTGKTLMALASGLTQVLDDRRYTEIIMTRATVSVGEDIGFLPGTEEEKMGPWMGALDDNLEVLAKTETAAGEWGRAATNELIRSRIKIKSMNFMRGRTFLNKYVIIDEAQNLTPKQMKTLITRAGPAPRSSAWATSRRSIRPTSPRARRASPSRWTSSRAGRTAGTSRWLAANARGWRTSRAKCSRAVNAISRGGCNGP